MKTIKVGIAGLGRLGKVHANNIAFKIPNATLTAACSIVPAELEYAKNELGVTDLYTDYREMLEKADIDAVAIGKLHRLCRRPSDRCRRWSADHHPVYHRKQGLCILYALHELGRSAHQVRR